MAACKAPHRALRNGALTIVTEYATIHKNNETIYTHRFMLVRKMD